MHGLERKALLAFASAKAWCSLPGLCLARARGAGRWGEGGGPANVLLEMPDNSLASAQGQGFSRQPASPRCNV